MWATSNDINLSDLFYLILGIEYRGKEDGDYHLLSPLLKIHIYIHDRLHERYVVPCSMLMLAEISKQRFFFASIFHVFQRAI